MENFSGYASWVILIIASFGNKLVVIVLVKFLCLVGTHNNGDYMMKQIKKFKDALVKYGADRCGLGPPKGLEEKELLALAANRDLSFNYTPKPEGPVCVLLRDETMTVAAAAGKLKPSNSEFRLPLPPPIPSAASPETKQLSGTDDRTFVPSGR